ncbi:MAG: cytidylate kinase family protein, partial [Desulfosalsimonas sp.]
MAVITISRHFGAGGRTLGDMVARQLGYSFEDDAIISEIANKAKVAPRTVEGHERVIGSL